MLSEILQYLLKQSSDIITISILGFIVILLLWIINTVLPKGNPLKIIFMLVLYFVFIGTIVGFGFWIISQKFLAAVG